MRELNDQERLAKLLGKDKTEPVDTASLLENALKNSLGPVSEATLAKTYKEIESTGNRVEGKKLAMSLPAGFSAEALLLDLYAIRDDLIGVIELAGVNNEVTGKTSNAIAKIEKFLYKLGGEVEEFIPLNHISGLSAPNQLKNAQKVLETTIQCYSLGEIKETKVKDGGKVIQLAFYGKSRDVEYVAHGEISADEWTGNEAIDYIYTPGEGNMTVKAFENGRWIVKNAAGNDKYKVVWALEEKSNKAQKKKIEAEIKETSEEKEEPVAPSSINAERVEAVGKVMETKEKDIGKKVNPVYATNKVDEDIGDPI